MPHIRDFTLDSLPTATKTVLDLDVATMPDGQPLRLTLLAARGREAGPTVVVLAGVHGDEYEGMLVIPEVFARLDPAQMRGTVLMVPICNVPAYQGALRSSPIDGLNMARVFPGDPNGTITQRIAYWLGERVIRHAHLLIDLHSAGLAYHIPPLVGYYHHDSAAGRRSQEVALAFGAEVVWAHPDVAAGRTVSLATDLGTPWIYTEAPGAGRVRPEDFALFTQGVLNSLKVMGVLDGAPETRPVRHYLLGAGDLDKSIAANAGGLFVSQVGLLDEVKAGDVLGEVRDPAGRVLETVYAPSPGVVISMRGLVRVFPGDGLFALTGRME
ncbi:MAG: succinylglutamate desuccinylase/aspartoacylase family protein [Anaerolineae bacterium]|nr:succinylglutamate desuccinylase/aspartoacylase family protein [Anaerolineae bacterium]